jgi:CDP-paratose 2-epimerase
MSVAVITGSAGLIGSEAALHFARQGMEILGIDNDMRQVFFGAEASTRWQRDRLKETLRQHYDHLDHDIRDADFVHSLFKKYGAAITLVIHTAAQPSHDWAMRDPQTDFTINANGTLNLLQATREHAPEAVFIFTSTNKVYGDTPNRLPLREHETRWEIDPAHVYADGIAEDMSIDQSHSLFGASRWQRLVQNTDYFNLKTAVFVVGVTGLIMRASC